MLAGQRVPEGGPRPVPALAPDHASQSVSGAGGRAAALALYTGELLRT